MQQGWLSCSIAHTIGHVISVTGSRIQDILNHVAPDHGDGASGLQIGGIVKVATPKSFVFGIVSSLKITDP
ncbi:MAG: hypothetical protein VX741_01630, partial [Pseudomonadota bacterium]|nr:hypothetical protein [Pseudomonadota bacterium]